MRTEKIGEGPVSSINFPSYEQLYKEFTPSRVAVLRIMAGAGPMSIREVARRLGRDFKGVHTDVTALFRNGFLKKTAQGQTIFPYDGLHFEFDVPAANLTAAE